MAFLEASYQESLRYIWNLYGQLTWTKELSLNPRGSDYFMETQGAQSLGA